MFGKRIKIFDLFGFSVHIDISWLIIAVLVTWSLASGLFPTLYPDLSKTAYWIMGVIGAIGLFLSIVVHEFSHSMIARKFGLPMEGITLFVFGGVAEMHDEPDNPKTEFFMALAGPVSSGILVIIFLILYFIGESAGWPATVQGILHYLWLINGILIAFNMVPGFPLDGGRVLRSILWHFKGDIRWATKIASRSGSTFGMILILLGVVNFIFGSFIGGLWWFLIGLFIRGASRSSYQRLLRREALEGVPLRKFMNPEPVTVSADISLEELVEDYVYRYHYKMFPVVDNGKLSGCITTRDIKKVPRERWSDKTVGEINDTCSPENSIEADEDSVEAFMRMRRTGKSRLMVTEGDRLVGVISLKDLAEFLSLKLELENGD